MMMDIWRKSWLESNASDWESWSATFQSPLLASNKCKKRKKKKTQSRILNKPDRICHSPSNQQEFSHQALTSHGHQYASDSHTLTEAGHHSSFGQMASEFLQELVKALLLCVTVYFIWVGDADPLFCCHVFKCFHTTLTIITYGGIQIHMNTKSGVCYLIKANTLAHFSAWLLDKAPLNAFMAEFEFHHLLFWCTLLILPCRATIQSMIWQCFSSHINFSARKLSCAHMYEQSSTNKYSSGMPAQHFRI